MNNQPIAFALLGMSTDQFATISDPTTDEGGLEISSAIKTDYKERYVGIGLLIKFTSGGDVFLQIESSTHFEIAEESWMLLSADNSQDVTLPKDFLSHLMTIAVGTTRGILHGKTDGTAFNKYFLPLIDVSKLDAVDVVIPKE